PSPEPTPRRCARRSPLSASRVSRRPESFNTRTPRGTTAASIRSTPCSADRSPAARSMLPPMQTAEGFVFVRPGLHLYYRTVGNGPEVVLVPNANWLAELLAPLSPGRTLLFYDPRSRGRSSTVSESRQLSLEADVEDLESVRRYFGADRISLLGSSYH